MFVVVNHLPVSPDIDLAAFTGLVDEFCNQLRPDHPGIHTMLASRPSDDEVTLVIVFKDRAFGEEFSSKIAAPWFAENMRRFLAGPARRTAGDMIAGFIG